jgi:hypothetical protein
MVGLTSEATHTKALKRKANITDDASSSSPQTKRQTILKQTETGQLGLQLPSGEAKVKDGFQQANVNKGFFQPKIVTIEQLKANRAALQKFNTEWMSKQPDPEPGFEQYQPSNLVQCDWSEYGINPGVTERMQSYIDTLMFRSVWEHDLDIGDTVVLLHKLKFANPLTNEDLLNRSHLLYIVDEIKGARKYLSFVKMMHTPSEYPELPGLFPNKVTILIDGNYISIEKSPDTHSEVQASHGSAEAVNQARPFHDSRRGDQHPDEEDNLSEDSDARRITKKSTMEVNGHTFEIYGKTAIRENLIKSTGIRRLMQTGHMVTLLRTSGHGSYGNTITAANIIDGVIKLADDNNATSIFSKLNTAVNHNKIQVALQAWWQHTDLHEKIAYGVYEFGHNLTKNSVRCEHFLPLAVATEINYNITTYLHFVEHFKGWRILLHELLGPRFGKLLQQFLTEMYDEHIGEKNGVPYLKALSEAWRCEFYRYSIRQDTFQIIGQSTVYDPQTMTTEDWLALLCLMWDDFKSSLTIIQEFEFNQNKIVNKVIECKPLGHKPKAALPQDVKVHKDEVKVRKDKKAPIKLATPVPLKKVKFEEIKKKPPARDNVCIGDLLNHYGASQQIACQSPCKYIHYTDIPHDMTKQSILQRFQGVAPRLALTDATVAFVTSKIKADTKYK